MNPTLHLVVHGDVGRALQESRPAVNHVHSALVLQVLSASLQRLDEVLVQVGADHSSLQQKTDLKRWTETLEEKTLHY